MARRLPLVARLPVGLLPGAVATECLGVGGMLRAYTREVPKERKLGPAVAMETSGSNFLLALSLHL